MNISPLTLTAKDDELLGVSNHLAHLGLPNEPPKCVPARAPLEPGEKAIEGPFNRFQTS
ncbi:MAG: hypothetical protein KAI47_16800 [Deltaproteobacteria bacterium]|nr:hypothetical protein [Deltaproteobacteria bacterium]